MFGNLFGGFGGFGGCGCVGDRHRDGCTRNSSCDVLWIIILLMVLFRGGLFGLDICTLVILFIIFGKDFFGGKDRCGHHERKC